MVTEKKENLFGDNPHAVSNIVWLKLCVQRDSRMK